MSAFDYFKPQFKFLAAVGYVSIIHTNVSKISTFIHDVYRFIILVLVFLFNVQLMIFLYQEQENLENALDVLFTLITAMIAFGKQLIFFFPHRLMPIINILKDEHFTADDAYGKELMDKNSIAMFRLQLLYLVAVGIFDIFYFLYHYYNSLIPGYFPFDNTEELRLVFSMLYLTILFMIQGFGNGTMDIIIISCFSQAKTQLRILQYKLEHIADNTKIEDRINTGSNDSLKHITDECFRGLLRTRVIKCLKRYALIKRLMASVENFFGVATTVQVFATSVVIGLSVYKADRLDILSTEFLSIVIYLFCIFFQLFMYSYFATQVQHESEFVSQSVYFSNWQVLTPSQCRDLINMMLSFSRPITLSIAFIIPLSLGTFISVVKASYSLYTLLNRT